MIKEEKSFPILTTKRLTLKQLSLHDHQNIFDLRSNKIINKYLLREPSKSIEGAKNFINIVLNTNKKNNSFYWVITLTKTKTFVGTICIFNCPKTINSCEIGFELLLKFQGKGIMKEAAEKVIDFVFETLPIKKIVAITHKENQNSIQLLTKLNFLTSKNQKHENADFIGFELKKI